MITVKRSAFYMLMGILLFSCDYESEGYNNKDHKLLFPNDGETLIQGNSYRVLWIDDQSITLRIRLLKSGNIYFKISEQAPNTGEFIWDIPDTLDAGNDYSIKILSNNNDFIYYGSEKSFKILKQSDTASFTDSRDGQVYKIVKLNDRWWMAQNFNYDTTGSYCYSNYYQNCNIYGRLYTLSAAKKSCPSGWHLPTDDEWQTLEAYLGIPLNEINTIGFRGINAGYLLCDEFGVGFNAKYSGYYQISYDRYNYLNYNTYFWTSSSDDTDSKPLVRQLILNKGGVERAKISGSSFAFSVRYIKDKE
jgi:uncharacterized protein (TIGR02145 family)